MSTVRYGHHHHNIHTVLHILWGAITYKYTGEVDKNVALPQTDHIALCNTMMTSSFCSKTMTTDYVSLYYKEIAQSRVIVPITVEFRTTII